MVQQKFWLTGRLSSSGNTVEDTESENETFPADDAEPVADVFAALSDPLRVEIIRALAAHQREVIDEDGAAFSTLRKAVGTVDSGRFRYISTTYVVASSKKPIVATSLLTPARKSSMQSSLGRTLTEPN